MEQRATMERAFRVTESLPFQIAENGAVNEASKVCLSRVSYSTGVYPASDAGL
jgi:hypothetical protein